MRNLFYFAANWSKARHIPSLTDFLVGNPMFRRLVLGYHQKSGQVAQEVDKWLEKELLTKEQYDKIYSDKRLDKSTSKRADKVYKDNKNKLLYTGGSEAR